MLIILNIFIRIKNLAIWKGKFSRKFAKFFLFEQQKPGGVNCETSLIWNAANHLFTYLSSWVNKILRKLLAKNHAEYVGISHFRYNYVANFDSF